MAWGLKIALLHRTFGLRWEEIHTRGPVVEAEEGPKASRILGLQRSLISERTAVGISTKEEGQL